jgi:DNA-binding GntR family transcriptional regulator
VPVPDLGDPRPPYVQIADDLRKKIADGTYRPGGKLPSQKALAEEYRTTPNTASRAVRVLADEGLVQPHSTMGTFVLREPGEPEPDPAVVRLVSALEDALRRLDKVEERLAALEKAPGSGPQ